MSVEPYRHAQCVFLIIDNGSAHRGQRHREGDGRVDPFAASTVYTAPGQT